MASGTTNDAPDVNDHRFDFESLHVYDLVPKPQWYHTWELRRPEWLQECAGEFFGVFFYCFAGMGATAALVVGQLTEQPFLGSLFNVGFAYALGIAFAVTVCAMSSSGHFNPAVTVAFAVFRDFPLSKVPRFIFAQILGGYAGSLAVYAAYRPYIVELDAVLRQSGKSAEIFSANGPAGIFSIYSNPGIPLRWVFANEFFADFFIGMVIWGVLDPSNIFVSTSSIPIMIAMAYAVAVWGFVPATIATNPARDLGGRLCALTVWGTPAWGGRYPLIASFAPFLATLFAATVYELLLSDSSRVVTSASREVISNSDRHKAHAAWKYTLHQRRRRELTGSLSIESYAAPENKSIPKD